MSLSSARILSLLLLSTVALPAQQTIKRAWEMAALGKTQDAIRLLDDLVRRDPDNPDVRLLLGSLLMEVGNRSESIDQLRAAVRLRPKSAEAENALGEAYGKFGDAPAAREAFERAVSLDVRFGAGQLNLGQALLSAGDVKHAADHLDLAIGLLGWTDDAANAHYLRAKAYTATGNLEQAEEHLRQAVKIRAGFAEAWSDLGQARRTLLDSKGALEALEVAVRLNPEDSVAQYRYGSECLRQHKVEIAIEHLEKAYKLNPRDQSTLNSLQMALRQAGKADQANIYRQKLADLLREKDRINYNQLTAIRLNNEGAALEASKDLLGATEKYREAAKLYPEMAGIRVNYAVALLQLGRWTEGLDQLHEAFLLDPANVKIREALKDALSQAPTSFRPGWSTEVR